MHVQVPTPTNIRPGHAPALVAALAAAAIAGGTLGVIAITNDNDSAQSPSPVVSKVADDRVLDGSPILRGTANAVDPNRVLDGSPLVRGSSPSVGTGLSYRHAIAPKFLQAPTTDDGRILDGSPLVRGTTKSSSVQGTLRPPAGQPYGFRSVP